MSADILTRLQQANGPSRELDRLIMCGIGGWHRVTPSQAKNKHGAFIAPEDWIGAHSDGSPILDSLHGTTMHREVPNVTGSLDASLALVKRKLPGWGGIISLGSGSSIHVADLWSEARGNQNTEDEEENPLIGEDAHGEHASLPIAILIALFLALTALETDNDHG